tara:strand:+ start:683 stop:1507 length:825 start_codon:yes stop_codon:yes gene_type:complete
VKNPIGVMQGRLLPKYKGLYQAHPKDYWQDEFVIAKDLGLDCIEFILDFKDSNENPLLSSNGIEEILSIVNNSGVSVNSICADYFMEAPLHSKNEIEALQSIEILKSLILNASLLKVKDIVIPCVEKSSLKVNGAKERFISCVSHVLDILESKKINLSLETDLPPAEFADLLSKINSKYITVNYDIGNSASLGYNPVEELDAYGDKITDIHIKDRLLGGGPVFLGEGDADFDVFFEKLKEFNYQGIFIMQAYRDNEGIEIFKNQLNWLLDLNYY